MDQNKKNTKTVVIAVLVGVFFILGIVQILFGKTATTTTMEPAAQEQTDEAASAPTEQPSTLTDTGFPRLTEETIDRNFEFSCMGGDTVVLWDKPTDAAGGARSRDRVPCDTLGWAFNTYYNEGLQTTFYAVQSNDSRAEKAYGWVTEDLLIWKE